MTTYADHAGLPAVAGLVELESRPWCLQMQHPRVWRGLRSSPLTQEVDLNVEVTDLQVKLGETGGLCCGRPPSSVGSSSSAGVCSSLEANRSLLSRRAGVEPSVTRRGWRLAALVLLAALALWQRPRAGLLGDWQVSTPKRIDVVSIDAIVMPWVAPIATRWSCVVSPVSTGRSGHGVDVLAAAGLGDRGQLKGRGVDGDHPVLLHARCRLVFAERSMAPVRSSWKRETTAPMRTPGRLGRGRSAAWDRVPWGRRGGRVGERAGLSARSTALGPASLGTPPIERRARSGTPRAIRTSGAVAARPSWIRTASRRGPRRGLPVRGWLHIPFLGHRRPRRAVTSPRPGHHALDPPLALLLVVPQARPPRSRRPISSRARSRSTTTRSPSTAHKDIRDLARAPKPRIRPSASGRRVAATTPRSGVRTGWTSRCAQAASMSPSTSSTSARALSTTRASPGRRAGARQVRRDRALAGDIRAIGLARSAASVEQIASEGKLVACIGIENGYAMGRGPRRDRGVPRARRALHEHHSQPPQPAGDSNTPRPCTADSATSAVGPSRR